MVTKEQISTLEFSLDGSPWYKATANPSIDVSKLTYSLDGSPWYGLSDSYVTGDYLLFMSSSRVSKMYVGTIEVPTSYVGGTELREYIINPIVTEDYLNYLLTEDGLFYIKLQ